MRKYSPSMTPLVHSGNSASKAASEMTPRENPADLDGCVVLLSLNKALTHVFKI
jgi:hypothetical protein